MGSFKNYLNENEEIQKKIFTILDEMDEEEIDEFGTYLYDEFFEEDDSEEDSEEEEEDDSEEDLFTLEDVKEMIEALGEEMLDAVLEMLEEDDSEEDDSEEDDSEEDDLEEMVKSKSIKQQLAWRDSLKKHTELANAHRVAGNKEEEKAELANAEFYARKLKEDLDESDINEDWVKLSSVKVGKVEKIKTNKSGKNYFYVVSFDDKDKEFEVVTPKAYNNGDTDKTMTISFNDVTLVSTDDLDESAKRAYLDISQLDRRDIVKLQSELEKTGLKIGTDFFLKSGKGTSWITYEKYDREPLAILMKHHVEEEDLDEAVKKYIVKGTASLTGKKEEFDYQVSGNTEEEAEAEATLKVINQFKNTKILGIKIKSIRLISEDLDEAMARRMSTKKMNKKKRKFMKKTKADLRKTVTIRKREARKSRPKRKRAYRANKIKIKSYQKSRSIAIKRGKHKVKVRRAA